MQHELQRIIVFFGMAKSMKIVALEVLYCISSICLHINISSISSHRPAVARRYSHSLSSLWGNPALIFARGCYISSCVLYGIHYSCLRGIDQRTHYARLRLNGNNVDAPMSSEKICQETALSPLDGRQISIYLPLLTPNY